MKASIVAVAPPEAPASGAARAGAAPAAQEEGEVVVEVGVEGDNRAVGKCWCQVSGVRFRI